MKGKIGLIVGFGAGYVLGTRAGRERFEQIRTQFQKVWNLDAVQEQVSKVEGFAKSQAAAVPGALWKGAVKVVKSATGSGTPGERLDSTLRSTKDAAEDVSRAVEETVEDSADAKPQKAPTTGATAAGNSTPSGS